jgi:hypothetical protein
VSGERIGRERERERERGRGREGERGRGRGRRERLNANDTLLGHHKSIFVALPSAKNALKWLKEIGSFLESFYNFIFIQTRGKCVCTGLAFKAIIFVRPGSKFLFSYNSHPFCEVYLP